MNHAFLSGLLLLALAGSVGAESQRAHFESPENQVVLLELFTSEGCSSCPPAERWLGSLTEQPGLWTEFVPLAFHVDYWDYIGWRDRFASSDYSQRQRRYAREGGLRSVYTPGVLQDGQEWRGWYRNPKPDKTSARSGKLSLHLDGREIQAAYRNFSGQESQLDVHVALLGMGLETRVKAGENDGRVLNHEFVVLGLTSAPLTAIGARHAAELSLPEWSQEAPRYALAAWVSVAGEQAPLQALGGYLDFAPPR